MILSPLSPLRLNVLMAAAPRSCTGWACSCAAPYGFGRTRNQICVVYGPGRDAEPNEIAAYRRSQKAIHLRAKKRPSSSETKAASMARYQAMKRRHESMQKRMEELDWHLEFEDISRTQGFFEMRNKQARTDEELWWENYRNEELASSARSIRNLMKDF